MPERERALQDPQLRCLDGLLSSARCQGGLMIAGATGGFVAWLPSGRRVGPASSVTDLARLLPPPRPGTRRDLSAAVLMESWGDGECACGLALPRAHGLVPVALDPAPTTPVGQQWRTCRTCAGAGAMPKMPRVPLRSCRACAGAGEVPQVPSLVMMSPAGVASLRLDVHELVAGDPQLLLAACRHLHRPVQEGDFGPAVAVVEAWLDLSRLLSAMAGPGAWLLGEGASAGAAVDVFGPVPLVTRIRREGEPGLPSVQALALAAQEVLSDVAASTGPAVGLHLPASFAASHARLTAGLSVSALVPGYAVGLDPSDPDEVAVVAVDGSGQVVAVLACDEWWQPAIERAVHAVASTPTW